MKRFFGVLLCVCVAQAALFAQEDDDEFHKNEAPVNADTTLKFNPQGRLGVEAGTEFIWDIENKSTGLETNVGIELYLPIFDKQNRGIYSESGYKQPGVRLVVKDMCFQWLEVFFTKGGNYEQDNVNSWTSRPLVLSYGDITGDVVWNHFFFQIATTTNPMKVKKAAAESIFDDLIDNDDRWYVKKDFALYSRTRYNKMHFPLLGDEIQRDFCEINFEDDISGQLGVGVEFSKIEAVFKAASLLNGEDNDNNAWILGGDVSLFPFEQMKIEVTALGGINCEKDMDNPFGTKFGEAGKGDYNPFSAGINVEYKLPFSGDLVLKPFVGLDYAMNLENTDQRMWELGFGAYLYFRGEEYLAKHRDIDYDEIIPVGVSVAATVTQYKDNDVRGNLILSAFELADRKALIPNLGYIVQLEISGMGNNTTHTAVAAQVEYLILGKILPYVFVKYSPQRSLDYKKLFANEMFEFKVGCYLTPVRFFSLDIYYKTDFLLDGKYDGTDGDYSNNGTLGVAAIIRL